MPIAMGAPGPLGITMAGWFVCAWAAAGVVVGAVLLIALCWPHRPGR